MFHIAMPSGGAPVAAIRRAVEVFLEAVHEVGSVREPKVSTRAGGENAHLWAIADDGSATGRRLADYPDVTAVVVGCDLRCEDRDGRTFVIPDGLTFWAQLAEIGSPPEEPIEINVTLDTDVYVARSWGWDRDNRALALRNAPHFNQFLAALMQGSGAWVESVSAGDYREQIDANGIVLAGN